MTHTHTHKHTQSLLSASVDNDSYFLPPLPPLPSKHRCLFPLAVSNPLPLHPPPTHELCLTQIFSTWLIATSVGVAAGGDKGRKIKNWVPLLHASIMGIIRRSVEHIQGFYYEALSGRGMLLGQHACNWHISNDMSRAGSNLCLPQLALFAS